MFCSLEAQGETRMRLGTVAPKDSSFHRILADMGTEWKKQEVNLKIFPGGARGGEAEIVSLMRNGALEAGLLTAVGLSEIDPSVHALQSVPMLFQSMEEVDYVGEKLRPRLEKRLRDQGFVVLFWADAGWVRFFSKSRIVTPDDLRKAKLFTWAGDVSTVDLYRKSGFQPVPLETSDILPSLQTGMINAVPLPPYVAMTTQVFMHAPYMLQLDWAPLVGALVVTEKSWNRLTPGQQRELARAAGAAGALMRKRNRLESDQAVAKMQQRGLKVTPVSPAVKAEWRKAVEQRHAHFRGSRIPADLFDEVMSHLAQYRSAARQIAASAR
ncbi:MAG TPA: TRAP transporter substrate-binding protein DctP [Thermoanaerobaculia bacterium]|nr:TRAP transporter substrate-binding protein DctP [Thermoanaerobaculia bacterium]